jgi:hypothetical protein
MEKLEKMRSIILEKQKSKEAIELQTAIQLVKEREIQEHERNKSASATIKSFITEVPEIPEETEEIEPEVPEEPEILAPKIPTFIIPFQETCFFKKHFSEIPIEVYLFFLIYLNSLIYFFVRNFQVKLMILFPIYFRKLVIL